MAKPVVIFGTGDFARVASVYLAVDSPHEVAAFTEVFDVTGHAEDADQRVGSAVEERRDVFGMENERRGFEAQGFGAGEAFLFALKRPAVDR